RYKNVILIFSVKESGKFQGFARLLGEAKHGEHFVPWVLPPGMNAKALGGVFKLEWLNRHDLWFSKCIHLRNPWNDNKEVKICRDGQIILVIFYKPFHLIVPCPIITRDVNESLVFYFPVEFFMTFEFCPFRFLLQIEYR
ncbi:predicted protein, partial [Nematostella vectensis]